ncbi:hypothetical protein HYPSUDRAFT_49171 [Hypholoma sublateritium FD-334 SS-4]|uniref:BTB domain-containing protein n=1 Tax=Hypholoma sublateritium (strain FD-334 SS-4) TaxID=945553 RepID=A0A0D2P1E2_HYPSF|nr:hypothetical protein HYPSUDRAFT_49171 [Hypholoma sublateritium FD-334 SS-4]
MSSPSSAGRDDSAPPPLKICPAFCDANADITFKSSDAVLFKIHSKYLAATSGGLQVPANFLTSPDEVIPLEEPSEILILLFQFIHPRTEVNNFRQPLVMNMKPDILFPLAEAAEKYQVFGAMNTCITRFYQLIKQYPLEILNHTYRHGYFDLANQVAIETISKPLDEIVRRLTHPGLLQRWVLYYDHWRKVAIAGITSCNEWHNPVECSIWPTIKTNYLAAVIKNSWDHNYVLDHEKPCVHSLAFGTTTCKRTHYVKTIQDQIALGIRNIPEFSDIVV